MKRNKFLLGLAIFILPVLLRVAWHYNGVSTRPEIKTPDYQKITLPQPAFSTPDVQEAVEPTGERILFDAAHTNLYEDGEIQMLVEALMRSGASVETYEGATGLENHLKSARAFVVISPSSSFSAEEIFAVEKFVHNGGRLLVLSDATRGTSLSDYDTGLPEFIPDVKAINPLLAPFDLRFNFDYVYNIPENEGNFRNVYFSEFGEAPITADLGKVVLYGAHSIESDTGTLLLLGDQNTFSSLTDSNQGGLAAAALSADGNVLGIGDFTFLSNPYNQVEDNGLLMMRVVEFLLGGERVPTLANYPFLFSQPVVSVLPVGDAQLNAEAISILAGVQSMFDRLGSEMAIVDEAPANGDLLIFGTFASDETLQPYLDEFDVTADEFAEFIDVPGFGKVGRFGIGLVLFKPGESGNTLILLTGYPEDLPTLFYTLGEGLSTSCVLRGEVAVCSIGYGGSFSEETYTGDTGEDTGTGEEGVTPTPTPSG